MKKDTKNDQKPETNSSMEELKTNLENKEKILQDYVNTLQRLQADFDNYTKRVHKEREEVQKYASAKLAIKLLNILDDFERTLKLVEKTNDKSLIQGIEMMQKQIKKILEDEGIKPIQAIGTKFDPFKHEIVDLQNGKEDDTVIEEIQKGYAMHDKVLRTSKVIVSKKEENKEEK